LRVFGLEQVHAARDAERVGHLLVCERKFGLELAAALVEPGERVARTEVDEKAHSGRELRRFVARHGDEASQAVNQVLLASLGEAIRRPLRAAALAPRI